MKDDVWLINIFVVFMVILTAYLVLTRLIGNSATDIQIMISLFLTLFSYNYKLNREVGELKTSTISSFDRVKSDATEIKNKISELHVLIKSKK